MSINDNDNDFKVLRSALKGMNKVDAPDYFEADLMRRIASEDIAGSSEKKSLRSFFFSKKFIPAASLVFTVVIVFSITLFNSNNNNPAFPQTNMLKSEIGKVLLVVAPENDKESVRKVKQKLSTGNSSGHISAVPGAIYSKNPVETKTLILTPGQKEQIKKLKESINKIVK